MSQFENYQFETMSPEHFVSLIHPAIAVILVFPLIGIATNYAWQTRQRRLQRQQKNNSNIPATIGREHVKIGRWLTTSLVVLSLLGLACDLINNRIIKNNVPNQTPFQVFLIILLFVVTIVALAVLYRARRWYWRGIFATLTAISFLALGAQDGVFRRTDEWYWSHYYYGIIATLLMVFSLAIVEEIYRDRANRWRYVHIILNCIALLLFIGQGFTGSRDLFELGLYIQPPTG